MAAGQIDTRLPISPRHDALDAIAHGINVLVGELRWAGARAKEAQEANAAELRAAVASAEARSSAMLKAIPDLMFVLRPRRYVRRLPRPRSQAAACSAQRIPRPHGARCPARELADMMMHALERALPERRPGRRRVPAADGRTAILRGAHRAGGHRPSPQHRAGRHGGETRVGAQSRFGQTADCPAGGRAATDCARAARRHQSTARAR